tara:strand:+ start:3458 stop:4303 length:846 start_codon:yes stop_codon:yes gene_type:complete
MRQRINRPRDVVIDIAEDAIARMAAAHPVETASRLARAAQFLGKAVKTGVSAEAQVGIAAALGLYGFGEEVMNEYQLRKERQEMEEKGYTRITSKGTSTYLKGPEQPPVPVEQGSARHSVPHRHSESGHAEHVIPSEAPLTGTSDAPPVSTALPLTEHGRAENPYSKAYSSVAKEGPPGLQSPLPLKMGAPLKMPLPGAMPPSKMPKIMAPSTPLSGHSKSGDIGLAAAAAALRVSADPMRRAYIKVPRFKIPKDKPYDLVKWDAATNAIANNMMANASED